MKALGKLISARAISGRSIVIPVLLFIGIVAYAMLILVPKPLDELDGKGLRQRGLFVPLKARPGITPGTARSVGDGRSGATRSSASIASTGPSP
jgi:hypothetical protein